MSSFTPQEYTDSIKALVASQTLASKPTNNHLLANDSFRGLLRLSFDNETQFICLYELFNPALKLSDETYMANLITDYFKKNLLNDLNKHILSDWAHGLNKYQKIALRVKQYGNPIIDSVLPEQFKTEEQWLDLAWSLLEKANYSKIKNIFDAHVALKKQPTKVKTVRGVINFLYQSSKKNPTIFNHFLEDYAWAGGFILTNKNADLVGKFFALASEKQIVQALEHEKLIPWLKNFKPETFIDDMRLTFAKTKHKRGTREQIDNNNKYISDLIRYAMNFSTSMNNPEKMPLALTFLDLFEKNIHPVSDIVGFDKKTNEDFVEFMVQVNNVKNAPEWLLERAWFCWSDFNSTEWNKQKTWMKLDKIVKQSNVTHQPKPKI